MTRGRIDAVVQALPLRAGRRRWIGAGLPAVLLALFVAACAPSVPDRQQDLCAVFQQHPDWYDYAKEAEDTWGVPAPILMAFVHHESSFRSDARPPRKYVLWIIPWGRVSSAKGYAQAQDPAWSDYTDERGSFFRSRSDMEDALDFVGWYNHGTSRELGIAKTDAYNLYLAYHEGTRRLPAAAAGRASPSCRASPTGWPRPRGATRRSSSAANRSSAAIHGGRSGPCVASANSDRTGSRPVARTCPFCMQCGPGIPHLTPALSSPECGARRRGGPAFVPVRLGGGTAPGGRRSSHCDPGMVGSRL